MTISSGNPVLRHMRLHKPERGRVLPGLIAGSDLEDGAGISNGQLFFPVTA